VDNWYGQEFAALSPYSTVIVLGKLQQSLYVVPLARMVFKLTMSNTIRRFEAVTKRFDTLVDEIRTCKNSERRIELLQRMRLLIDEIDELIFTSLDRENKQARRANPNLIPEEFAS